MKKVTTVTVYIDGAREGNLDTPLFHLQLKELIDGFLPSDGITMISAIEESEV
ncbi:hypothetical protein [Mycobacterium sp. Root265]|uniref:hypothetical protein n=1 Tax=Mycobacterium sp. Root265 TaxID=1736504 RepID=UPI000A5F80EC|nr:hypothetical protein [Mycobacterium sp. Root265]